MDNFYRIATALKCVIVGIILMSDKVVHLNAQGYRTPVRLINPSSSMSFPLAGRLEVWYNGTWGTVCDDWFTDAAARVVCFSLGFGRTGRFIQNAFESGSGQIWLDDVSCAGTEIDIDSCSHSPWGSHDCRHIEDVVIRCGYIQMRLVNPSSSRSSPSVGRLEVRLMDYGDWGTVCDDHFNDAAARVVCSSLGFGVTGSFIGNAFGAGSGQIWLDDVICTGNETGIDGCYHSPWGSHNCNHSDDVSISCIGLMEESSQERFGLGAIVGTIVGVILVASIAILFLLFYRKRRNEVNQPQQTKSSGVDNGPGVADTDNANVYEMLDQTSLEMTEYEAVYTQLNAQTLLPVAP